MSVYYAMYTGGLFDGLEHAPRSEELVPGVRMSKREQERYDEGYTRGKDIRRKIVKEAVVSTESRLMP